MQKKQKRQAYTMSYLNVRGNVQNPIKPVDIVLVIDMSGSMEGAKETAIQQGVSDFLVQRLKTLPMLRLCQCWN